MHQRACMRNMSKVVQGICGQAHRVPLHRQLTVGCVHAEGVTISSAARSYMVFTSDDKGKSSYDVGAPFFNSSSVACFDTPRVS